MRPLDFRRRQLLKMSGLGLSGKGLLDTAVTESFQSVEYPGGTQEWAFRTTHSVRSSPTVVDGTVYVGPDDRHLCALDIDSGEREWSLEDVVWSSSTVIPNHWQASGPCSFDSARISLIFRCVLLFHCVRYEPNRSRYLQCDGRHRDQSVALIHLARLHPNDALPEYRSHIFSTHLNKEGYMGVERIRIRERRRSSASIVFERVVSSQTNGRRF